MYFSFSTKCHKVNVLRTPHEGRRDSHWVSSVFVVATPVSEFCFERRWFNEDGKLEMWFIGESWLIGTRSISTFPESTFSPSVMLNLCNFKITKIQHFSGIWMSLYHKSVAYYLCRAHSRSCSYWCSSFRKCIIMQSNFVFFASFNRGSMRKIHTEERETFWEEFMPFLFQRVDLPGARTGGLPPIGGSPSRGARI